LSHQRFVVVDTSGSGKTSFARRLAKARSILHIELDALHWEANWTEAEDDVFLSRVEQATSEPAWVVDGNYAKSRPFVWQRADAIVWLDYLPPGHVAASVPQCAALLYAGGAVERQSRVLANDLDVERFDTALGTYHLSPAPA
jgi:hypothetical protein